MFGQWGLLAGSDFKRLVAYFESRRVVKLLVALVLMTGLGAIVSAIYWGTYGYLQTLNTYEEFGKIVIEYLLRSATLLTVWLGTWSGVMVLSGTLAASNKELELLISMPVKRSVIADWILSRTLASSLFWASIVLLPPGLAILKIDQGALGGGLGLGLWLALATMSANFLAVLGFTKRIKLSRGWLSTLTIGIFLIGSIAIFGLILPHDLPKISILQKQEFVKSIRGLALFSPGLPTNWVYELIKSRAWVSVLGLCLMMMASCWYLIEKRLDELSKRAREGLGSTIIKSSRIFQTARGGLWWKDVLSLIRDERERVYAILLGALPLICLYYLNGVTNRVSLAQRYRSELVLVGAIWMFFYLCAYALRFIFPLMSKEGQTNWILRTLPIGKQRILLEKIVAGAIIILPVWIIVAIVWGWSGLAGEATLKIEVVLAAGVAMIGLVMGIIGAAWPNYGKGETAETVSTSLPGIAALVVSLGIGLGTSFQLLNGVILLFLVTMILSLTRYWAKRVEY